MRKFLFGSSLMLSGIASVTFALAGCATLPLAPPPPVVVADRTMLDEQVGQGVELAYKAFRLFMEARVDAGKLRGAAATRAAVLDTRAYALVATMRDAYATGNATSYKDAAAKARSAIAAALVAATGSN